MCYIDDSYKMIDILRYSIDNTKLDLEKVCPVLYNYLKKRKLI